MKEKSIGKDKYTVKVVDSPLLKQKRLKDNSSKKKKKNYNN